MARLLIDRGYKNVRPLLGGFDAWVEKGFLVESLPRSQEVPATVTERITSA